MNKLEELKRSDDAFITPAVAASVIGCDPNNIRLTAQQRPELLGFPVCVVGRRVKIPRLPFIQFVEGTSRQDNTCSVVGSGGQGGQE